jgi:SAM-dependent methyltransferase
MTTTHATDRNIAHWDQIFASRSWGKYPPEELIRFIARTFPDATRRNHLRALEIGCGPGANLWCLAREGFQVAGIDGSAHAIAQARERLRCEGLGMAEESADLRVGNFETLPWENAVFDVVIDLEALTANTPSTIQAAIKEVARVLKPDGWFLSKMFGAKTTGILSGRLMDPATTENATEGALAGVGILHAFSEDEIRRELREFAETRIDWVHRSDRNRTSEIFEWVVQARR